MVKVKLDDKGRWQVVHEIEGGMYIDGYLKSNLDYLVQDVRDDSDAVVIIDGKERSGKSVLALQVATYLEGKSPFPLTRVCFSPAEFKAAVLAANKYEVVIFDEAITGMRAQRWGQEVNQVLIELLAQIGQKNLFIIVVIPSFFELGKYISIHRSVALLHVYRKDGKRGFFSAFDEDKKKTLYLFGKKGYDYSVVGDNFHSVYTNYYPVNEEEYRAKKLDSLMKYAKGESQELSKREIKVLERHYALVQALTKDFSWTRGAVIEAINRRAKNNPLSLSELTELLAGKRGVWARFGEALAPPSDDVTVEGRTNEQ